MPRRKRDVEQQEDVDHLRLNRRELDLRHHIWKDEQDSSSENRAEQYIRPVVQIVRLDSGKWGQVKKLETDQAGHGNRERLNQLRQTFHPGSPWPQPILGLMISISYLLVRL